LADTSLYANQLASFTVENWQHEINVALAADTQGIYQPDWDGALSPKYGIGVPNLINTYGWNSDMYTAGEIDVANLYYEDYWHYHWESVSPISGFVTEVYELGSSLETIRRIDRLEEFRTVTRFTHDAEGNPVSSQYTVLVTQVLAQYAGSIDIYVDDTFLDTQWIPEMPGNWYTIATYIPPEVQSYDTVIRIVPTIPDGYYMPAFHEIELAYTGTEIEACCSSEPKASFQDNAFVLLEVELQQSNTELSPRFSWYVNSNPTGDYLFFVHLYDDINQPPVAQSDKYFEGMPVGNWQIGDLYSVDRISLNIGDLPNGTYSLAIGFYNPRNPLDRLMPESDVYEVTSDGRLWLGEVEIRR
jgi:hypothetical protein